MTAALSPPIRLAVLTVSDRCARGEREDASGPALIALCQETMQAELAEHACVPDDAPQIEARLRGWANASPTIDLILTTGGTGLAPRDVTPEAASSVIDRPHPALLELARLRCLEKTPRAFLTRMIRTPGTPCAGRQD